MNKALSTEIKIFAITNLKYDYENCKYYIAYYAKDYESWLFDDLCVLPSK